MAAVTDDTPLADVVFAELASLPGYPTYTGDNVETDCFPAEEEGTPDGLTDEELAELAEIAQALIEAFNETWGLTNVHNVTTLPVSFGGNAMDEDGNETVIDIMEMEAKTGWRPALSTDESVMYDFVFEVAIGPDWNN